MNTEICEFSTEALMLNAAFEHITKCAHEAIALRGRFVLVLAGGNTPKALYQLLAASQQDWPNWHVIYGDERHLPVDHQDRNQTMVQQSLGNVLNQLQHYPVPFNGNIDNDAALYAATIEKLLPADCCLLGIGEDGHTASLFPGFPTSSNWVSSVKNAPKPPSQRITLTQKALNDSAHVFFIAVGEEKLQVIKKGLQQKTLPFSQINGRQQTQFFIYLNN